MEIIIDKNDESVIKENYNVGWNNFVRLFKVVSNLNKEYEKNSNEQTKKTIDELSSILTTESYAYENILQFLRDKNLISLNDLNNGLHACRVVRRGVNDNPIKTDSWDKSNDEIASQDRKTGFR